MGRSRKRLPDKPFELEVDALDSKGLGLAMHGERQLHVYDALPGEKVLARYLFGRSQRGKAETLDVLDSSEDRVQARCPHFGVWGACSLQHMSIEAQLARKQSVLLDALQETGRVTPALGSPPRTGPQWTYRRKARFSATGMLKPEVLLPMLEVLVEMVADGRFAPVIDRTYPLDQLVEAHRYMETGHKRGNVVVA